METSRLLVGAMLLLAGGAAEAALQPRVMDTRWPTSDVVIASVAVEPPADATSDAAPAIQAAIDEAFAAGGAVVYLPVGQYRLASPLIIREGVTLRGDWRAPDRTKPDQTTLLMPIAGRGDTEGTPAITMDRGSGLREVSIWYPEQDAAAPVAYPWTVECSKTVTGDNMTITNVTLVNSWRGVKIGPDWNELHTLRQVYGTPLALGVFIDTTTDIGRLDGVFFGPRWWARSGLPGAPTEAALRPVLAQATGVDMGRSDWEFVYDLDVTGYGTGMVIRQGAQGTTNAVMYGCDLTDCGTALRVEALNGIGLAATACRFTGETGIATTTAFTTVAQFNSCEISSVEHVGEGVVTLQHCRVTGTANAQQGTLSALDCDLGPVVLAEGVQAARLLGCRWRGQPDIQNASRGDVGVSHAKLGVSRPDVALHRRAPARRPARDDLFVATDYGVAASAADNTAALQAALDAAGAARGGTVYLPAGRYHVRGAVRVPSGVELRGIFDVPHHTQSAGSVIYAHGGQGDENAEPLISLEPGAGVRGLTVWHPAQNVVTPVAFPWVVRGLGPDCYAIDLTCGNAWRGIDFGTHPSRGHVVQYLAGAFLHEALWVSKSAGDGWVEDVQGNPHYSARVPADMPAPAYEGDPFGQLIAYQRANLKGLVFGSCRREHIKGTFLYAAYDGISFVRDEGVGPTARVLLHGSDTVSRPAHLAAGNVEGHLMQVVPLSDQEVAAFVTDPEFDGRVRFDNSQVWAGHWTGQIEGTGDVLISQFNTLTGPFRLAGGRARLVGGYFAGSWKPAVTIDAPTQGAAVIACLSREALDVDNRIGEAATLRANGASSHPQLSGPAAVLPAEQFSWRSAGRPWIENTIATPGGGQLGVSDFAARVVLGESDESAALRLSGDANPGYAFAYALAARGPVGVRSDTVLSYELRPENEAGRNTFVDLVFTDGSTLRDSNTSSTGGTHARAVGGLTTVGEWRKIDVPLGGLAGRVIDRIMFAYDTRDANGPFSALLRNVAITSEPRPDAAATVVRDGQRTTVTAPAGWRLLWTADGSNPADDGAPVAEASFTGRRGQLNELRWRLVSPDGTVLRAVQAVVW